MANFRFNRRFFNVSKVHSSGISFYGVTIDYICIFLTCHLLVTPARVLVLCRFNIIALKVQGCFNRSALESLIVWAERTAVRKPKPA